jgi:hypothetical protein
MKVRKVLLRLLALIPITSIMFAAKQALAYDGIKAPKNGKIERADGPASLGNGGEGGIAK